MQFNNRENKCHIIDGREIWHSRSVAVVGMVLMLHEGETYVLMGKRGGALPNEVGKFCMPCGYLDWGETTEEAVVREIWEETGLNIDKTKSGYNIIEDKMDYPWKIHSDPETQLQNVSLHYAIYFDSKANMHRDIARLPEVTIENNPSPFSELEKNFPDKIAHMSESEKEIERNKREVDEVKWIKVEDLHRYEIAFNHDSTINVFVNNLSRD